MIYLDHNATTPVDGQVLAAMLPYFSDRPGNPSSSHGAGRVARLAVARAREQLASAIGAEPQDIIFTSGGTESIATALRSAMALQPEKPYLLVSAIEHSATWKTARAAVGPEHLLVVPVSTDGRYDLAVLEQHLAAHDGKIALASLMWANNETGGLPGLEDALPLLAAHGVPVHTDAVQAIGKVPVDVNAVPVDFLSLAGHKFQAPKGIGALWVRHGMRLHPLLLGGGQENGRRAGTENVPAIVGLGEAAALAAARLASGSIDAMRGRRNHLENALLERVPRTHRVGSAEHRTPNTTCLRFNGAPAAALLVILDVFGLACSSGSACASLSPEPSRVLLAHGLTPEQALQSLRFSLSTATTDAEIAEAITLVEKAVLRVRSSHVPSGPVVRHT